MKVLFLLPYPLHRAPSQRFRVEEYTALLDKEGISYKLVPFLDEKAWSILYKKGSLLRKALAVLKGFLKRSWLVFFASGKYDFVFIHREAAPIGPPIFEWWLAKIRRKKIVYDFDDAIWIPNVTEGNRLARFVKAFWKVKYICKWAYKVSAGNDYLAAFASRYNKNVVYNPTCVNTDDKYVPRTDPQNNPVVIGWTGSHSTLPFLAVGIPAIKKLELEERFRFVVIGDKKPDFDVACMEFVPWNKATEIEDLAQVDIGIMPLKDDAWNEGKCGFKLIQYLALGIPALASPIGVNKKIIVNGENGYLCASDEEWIQHLKELMYNKELRKEMGENGRAKIVREYSIASNSRNFINLFS